jgi:hypothetical protein
MSGRGLVAWIEPKDGHYVAAFVSAKTRWLRDPATRLFSAVEEARRWVGQEAAALGGVPVVWERQPYASQCCLITEADRLDRAA